MNFNKEPVPSGCSINHEAHNLIIKHTWPHTQMNSSENNEVLSIQTTGDTKGLCDPRDSAQPTHSSGEIRPPPLGGNKASTGRLKGLSKVTLGVLGSGDGLCAFVQMAAPKAIVPSLVTPPPQRLPKNQSRALALLLQI